MPAAGAPRQDMRCQRLWGASYLASRFQTLTRDLVPAVQ
jgi:hypothetical protein